MPVTTIEIAASPDRVFEVLADARCYAEWVVGNQEVTGADPGFPAVGASFYPRVGFRPVVVDGKTTVLESERPHRLVLHARALPVADAIVALELEASGAGTVVTMREDPVGPAPLRLAQRIGEPLLHRRNVESVRRLKALAERDG
ncbi:MAG TPA: SRPBCC domain-containing protein [Gaiellaceae bacterium]|nr:SRPBCC domain-containing protein [Gaiellaceae bacterium]